MAEKCCLVVVPLTGTHPTCEEIVTLFFFVQLLWGDVSIIHAWGQYSHSKLKL